MNPEPDGDDVVIVIAPRGATDAADRRFLAAAAAVVLGVDPLFVRIDRRCSHCDGRDHGRPQVAVPPGTTSGSRAASHPASRPLHVSLSRAGRCVAYALTFLGPVGIDIESVADVSRARFDAVAFGPAELAVLGELSGVDAAEARARLWTAKEAALKCTGDGLRVDPRDLTITLPGRRSPDAPRLAGWHGARVPIDAIMLRGVEPGPGLVGTVAVLTEGVLTSGEPTVRLVPAADIRHDANAPA
ncbi:MULTISPECIES: 4'-phosphopantetheinyl transferase superfamily protein [unclassified Cryobacterium]|uniref:4'-phosphopantetheinyl transferase family protein n=1 Tax=unclassified Cryobacterium TaxID=2649013 RepID=UPI00141B3905|nr:MULTISPECIES: 4'-phosphopantetheinyl transferase superfamily protein [unclassified Cryobacterium]